MFKTKHVYRKIYWLNSDSSKISIKLAFNQNIDTIANITTAFDKSYITQFEYIFIFYILFDLFYNIFNIDKEILYFFAIYNLELDKTTRDYQQIVCFVNNSIYFAIYTISSDNYAMYKYKNNNTFILTFCLKTNNINIYFDLSQNRYNSRRKYIIE